MNIKKTGLIAIILILLVSVLSGCNLVAQKFGNLKDTFTGRSVIMQSYDEESNIIDRIEAKSVSIGAEDKFATVDKDGNKTKKSGVLSLTVGGKSVVHVGSSMIIAEKGITNVFEEYAKTTNIKNNDRSVPFVNRMVNSVKNLTTGQNFAILIRSQTGKPLATYVGNDISYFATDVDKSTGFIIDGKYLFVYRCDYTVYDLSLLQ